MLVCSGSVRCAVCRSVQQRHIYAVNVEISGHKTLSEHHNSPQFCTYRCFRFQFVWFKCWIHSLISPFLPSFLLPLTSFFFSLLPPFFCFPCIYVCKISWPSSVFPKSFYRLSMIDHLPVKSIHLTIHQSINPSIHPSINPVIYPSVHQSIHPSIHQSSHLSIRPSIQSSIHPSMQSSIHPSIYPSIKQRKKSTYQSTEAARSRFDPGSRLPWDQDSLI